MKHFYDRIPGMFNFQDLYRRMVREADGFSHFVEVGSFLGKSAAFMAVEIINSEKPIVFDVVDTFQGSPGDNEHAVHVSKQTNDYYSQFLANIQPSIHMIRPYPIPSIEASCRYEDESLDFVYIDAAHDYVSVRSDIFAWLRKVKKTGYIGGHDYRSNCPGVWRAVNQKFGEKNVERMGTSWLIKKSEL